MQFITFLIERVEPKEVKGVHKEVWRNLKLV